MRISVLVNEFNIRGGTHKQVHRLMEYLISNGFDPVLITKSYDPKKCYPGVEKFKIVSFERYYTGSSQSNIFRRLINRIIGSFKIAKFALSHGDCVNVHDNGFGLTNFFLKILDRKVPVVWQINDLPPVFSLGNSKNGQANWTFPLRRLFYRHVAQKVDLITVNVTKNALRVRENLHVEAEVIYCGVDLKQTSLKPTTIKSSRNVSLLTTGVFLEYRNYETFLEVHQNLSELGYTVDAKIVGSTALNPGYASKIKDLIAEKDLKCEITGDISEERFSEIFLKSDYFLFINIDQSWGLAIFEAMNFGIPVIVSNSVGAVELLEDGVDSIIVDPRDAVEISSKISNLIKDDNQRNKLIKNAFDSTLEMTWDKMYSSKVCEHMISLLKN